MASHHGRRARPRAPRCGQDRAAMEPYLGAQDFLATVEMAGGVRKFRRPEGPTLVHFQQTMLSRAAEAERELPELLQKIYACAIASDPLMLLSRLHAFDAMRRSILPGPTLFGSDALLEFYGGLVTAMPEERVLAQLGTDDDPQALYTLDALLRDYGIAENLIGQGRALIEGAANTLARAQHELEFEHRFDRMFGYRVQLGPIFEAILGPIANQARMQLGFAPGDALIVADAYAAVWVERMRAVRKEFDRKFELFPIPADPEARLQYLASHFAGLATFGAAPVEDDLPGFLAQRTGIPREELAKLVEALSTTLGSQPDLKKLGDTNTLRNRPIIALPGGRYLWVRPVDFIHAGLDWVSEVLRGQDSLTRRYEDSRQQTCERLSHQTLAGIFGARTHARVTYSADGRPDIDVLVALPGVAVVVEAKGGLFTEPARRAAPERVRKKAREFVDKALAQNARSIAHLESGAADLRDKQKRRLTVPPVNTTVSVIVTLDRVDPFATHLPDGGKRGDAPKDGTWFVALADLLLAADVLRNPAEFLAYAQARAAMNAAGGPRVFTEADVLSAWCEHRIRPTRPQPGEIVLLSTTSEIMNDYYTHVAVEDAGVRPPRPNTHVPAEILQCLDEVLENHPERWYGLASAVMQVTPKQWLPVQKVLKAMSEPQTTKEASRHRRKRIRSATSGIRLSPDLTVYFESLGATWLAKEDPTALLVIADKRNAL